MAKRKDLNAPQQVDVAIIGGGPAGLSMARALGAQGLAVAVLEKQPLAALAAPKHDGREVAMTHLSRRVLADLGVWERIPAEQFSHIARAKVYNGDFSQEMDLSSDDEGALGFIVSNHLIRKAVYDAVAEEKTVEILGGTVADDVRIDTEAAHLRLSDGRDLKAGLLIIADSRFSPTRKQLDIPAEVKEFGKVMTVCRFSHEIPHHHIARECFLYDGWTMALLPLLDNRISVVLTSTREKVDESLALSPEAFARWVEDKIGGSLGKMTLESDRHAYPMVGVYAERFTGPRWALLGDAAVGMHPVTAHGFNFGLRGVLNLSESIRIAKASGLEPSSPTALLRYDRLHKQATRPLYLMTNGIVQLYTSESAPARMVRSVLLKAADTMSPIKNLLMRKLMEKS